MAISLSWQVGQAIHEWWVARSAIHLEPNHYPVIVWSTKKAVQPQGGAVNAHS